MERTISKQKPSKHSFSPVKGSKYKNFLSSILSPSSTKKKHLRQELQQQIEQPVHSNRSIQLSHDSIYSSIEDMTPAVGHRNSPSLPSANSSDLESLQNSPIGTETKAASEEPVYAVVHKPPVKPKRVSYSHVKEPEVAAMLEMKEENKILRQRLKELSEQNTHLKRELQDFEKQEELKEATFHSKLQLEITQLEAETRKEVKTLTEHITLLAEEKSLLSGQVDLLHQEKREAVAKCEALTSQVRKKVDLEQHNRAIAEYRRLLEQAKQRCNAELNQCKENCEVLSTEKVSLEATIEELNQKMSASQSRIETLEKEQRASIEENVRLKSQLEESRQLDEEHQQLLLSLLKMTETLAVERDILLNKTSFQESQQKELQTSVVGYSLNIGRLQEHISSLGKENIQELLQLSSKKSYRDESVHEYYAEQLDILREKILNQNNAIVKLECEKKKLEIQLENKWESYT